MTADTAAALGRRDRKKQQTRAALVDSALRLVAERGLDNVTVEDISDAADVSSRTFFNYFSCKDEVLVDGQATDSEAFRLRLVAVPPEVPVIGAIRLALAPIIAQMEVERERWLLRIRVVADNPILLSRLLAGGADAEGMLADTVAARLGIDPQHRFPRLVTAVTGAAFRTAMVRWAAGPEGQSLAHLVDEAFGDLAAGLPDPSFTRHRQPRPAHKDHR